MLQRAGAAAHEVVPTLNQRVGSDQAQTHVELIQGLIRGKKFRRYLINNCYPIAVDGSQKFARDTLWEENLLQRTHGTGEHRHTQYFVYILEASLAFRNGMVNPLLSEFLEYAKGDTDNNKKDCEQRAFHRLGKRLKALFPRLPVLLLFDGLYANGPVMQRCRQFRTLTGSFPGSPLSSPLYALCRDKVGAAHASRLAWAGHC